jgi:[glutamine synthetase] adenylyltransferase / [glutamine synthetase]-adenylyl-L-tyrosine phosphorylase
MLKILSRSQEVLKDLVLASTMNQDEVASLLKPYGFQDIQKADVNIQSITQSISDGVDDRIRFAEILEASLSAFSTSPCPDEALNNFERFCTTAFSKGNLLSFLLAAPLTLRQSAQIFGGSPFLSDILIRNPEYFYWVFDDKQLNQSKNKAQYKKEIGHSIRVLKTKESRLDMLRIFKRKEILRIGVRDLLRTSTVKETLRELSSLADVLIERALWICEHELKCKYGRPLLQDEGQVSRENRFSVLALGKLGSLELNFSSDVDLLFLYASRLGKTSGVYSTGRIGSGADLSDSDIATGNEVSGRIDNIDYFDLLSKEITSALNDRSDQGYVYRVDLRLRPEGSSGPIALSLFAYQRYYEKRGAVWERLALLRTRTVAGNRSLGREFLMMVSHFSYKRPFERQGLDAVKDCKEKIDQNVGLKDQMKIDVKLGLGGIREIEFIVHSLQLYFGRNDMTLRKIRTTDALKRLVIKRHLSSKSEGILRTSYLFLRDLENKLQMVNDHQTYLIPRDPAELRCFALRLGYIDTESGSASEHLKNDYRLHTEKVHEVFLKLFYPEK